MNENLKKQEAEFRAHCKDEMNRLQDSINKLKTDGGDSSLSTEDQERNQMIQRQYDADSEKLHKIRLLLVGLWLMCGWRGHLRDIYDIYP